jgi:hypothetical protein
VTTSTYTFLPWARRGLAGRTPVVASTAPLPATAQVDVGLTLSGLPEATRRLGLYGPGDVLGIDPRLVVRTDPRPGSVGVEPNYLPLVELDPPDLPWLFTPASSSADDRLRPWCVLVVVDLAVVRPPRPDPGRPLPVLEVPGPLVATELPDLTESWAWAHTQLLGPEGEDPAAGLAARPAMTVSRLLAPRHLKPRTRYAACLVPAFDAGVARGLGGEPSGAQLRPAWPVPGGGDVTLPVYYSWPFSTGAGEDFETLARRLRPFPVPPTAGGEPIYVGAAGPELPARPPSDPRASLSMDGALRAWSGASGALTDVPAEVRTALRATLDAAGAQATNGSQTPSVLGPPLYGGWPARRHTVPDGEPHWLRELNLDPRTRAAAGVGAEIVRQHQDQFLQWCWEQVEQVLESNRLLSRARLSMEALARVYARHLAPLPEDRLLQLTAPLHSRTRRGDVTIRTSIRQSSLPDAADDPALRRLTSPQRPVLRVALGRAGRAGGAAPRVRLVSRLAVSAEGLPTEPTEFVPHALLGIPAMATLPFDPNADTVDLTPIGMPVAVPTALVNQVRADTALVLADRNPRLVHRDDLSAGMLGERHVQEARDLREEVDSPWYGLFDLLSLVRPQDRITDPGTIDRLETAVTAVAADEVVVGRPPPPFIAFGMGSVSASLLARTDPRVTVPARVATMVILGGAAALDAAGEPIRLAPTRDRVMVSPRIDVPLYSYLAQLDPTRFLPGVGEVPENSLTVLKTNPRFVEALLVGVNHEMARELLWRGFPTDQRGTPFRRFWDREAAADIADLHTWPGSSTLGEHGPGDPDGQVALLVRGELLQRYPNACLYAWRADGSRLLRSPQVPEDLRSPVFAGVLGADVTFVGFELSATELAAGDGWFFVLSEQPTEPRFGFDELDDPDGAGTPPPLTSWSAATWAHTDTAPGAYLRIDGNPLAGTSFAGVRFVDHAAHLAALTRQRPMRVALHAGGLPELGAP